MDPIPSATPEYQASYLITIHKDMSDQEMTRDMKNKSVHSFAAKLWQDITIVDMIN